jgi:hypothetical protein
MTVSLTYTAPMYETGFFSTIEMIISNLHTINVTTKTIGGFYF